MNEPKINQYRRLRMSTTTLNNGVRKTLASQLDRLDTILDGLAENLNEAVAMAPANSVKEIVNVAVQEAVRAALVEILTNAEVQKRLINAPPATPTMIHLREKARSCWSCIVHAAKGTWTKIVGVATVSGNKVKGMGSSLVTVASTKVRQARKEIVRSIRKGWMLMTALAMLAKRFRTQLVVAVGVGVLVGVVCYFAGREIASIGCGLSGFLGSLATGAVNRLRRMLPFLIGSG
jgi:hypothetical protein